MKHLSLIILFLFVSLSSFSQTKLDALVKSAHDAEYTLSQKIYTIVMDIKKMDSTIKDFQYQVNNLQNSPEVKDAVNTAMNNLNAELASAQSQFISSGITDQTLKNLSQIQNELKGIIGQINAAGLNPQNLQQEMKKKN